MSPRVDEDRKRPVVIRVVTVSGLSFLLCFLTLLVELQERHPNHKNLSLLFVRSFVFEGRRPAYSGPLR